jgi:hypothetical protein
MAQGTPAAGGLHSVVMSHSRSNFDRKRRVAVASALVAAALVACAVVSTSTSSPEAEGSWLGRPTEVSPPVHIPSSSFASLPQLVLTQQNFARRAKMLHTFARQCPEKRIVQGGICCRAPKRRCQARKEKKAAAAARSSSRTVTNFITTSQQSFGKSPHA